VLRAAAKSRVELNPRNHLQVWSFKSVDFATGLELGRRWRLKKPLLEVETTGTD
jgi:hypothetical protein